MLPRLRDVVLETAVLVSRHEFCGLGLEGSVSVVFETDHLKSCIRRKITILFAQ